VPETKIYSHVAFAVKASPEPLTTFAPPAIAFGPRHRAGFSTYPAKGLVEELSGMVNSRGAAPWASAEGANVLLVNGASDSGMTMETYLAQLFNRGAVLVNVFGWGLGTQDYVFRKAAENPTALAAYRKFLNGQALIEGPITPTIVDRIAEKITRIQSVLPGWVQRNGRHREVKQLTDELDAAMATGDPVKVEAAEDAILALAGGG